MSKIYRLIKWKDRYQIVRYDIESRTKDTDWEHVVTVENELEGMKKIELLKKSLTDGSEIIYEETFNNEN